MRQMRLLAIALLSFLSTLLFLLFSPGTLLHRTVALLTCGIFSFTPTICSTHWAEMGDRTLAATPPSLNQPTTSFDTPLLSQRNREFDDEPTTPSSPSSNPTAPPYPNQINPTAPLRPDFENQDRHINQINTEARFNIISQLKEISPGLYETTLQNSQGCQIFRRIKKIKESTSYESIKYSVPNVNTCGGKSYTFKFSPDFRQIIAETSLGEIFVIKSINPNLQEIKYRDIKGREWLFESKRIERASNVAPYAKALEYSQNLTKDKAFTLKEKASSKSIDSILLGMNCDMCKMADSIFGLFDIANSADTGIAMGSYAGSVGGKVNSFWRTVPKKFPDLLEPASEIFLEPITSAIDEQLMAPLRKALGEATTAALNCHPSSGACAKLAEEIAAQEAATDVSKPNSQRTTPAHTSPITNTPNGVGACGSSLYGGAASAVCAPTYKLKQGRSYGDPHLITFDGYRYSFQTVGEFTLTKAKDSSFEVQVRQGAVLGQQLSLNTGVAMKVGDSRVAFYSKDFPDSETSIPLRVNGKPTIVQGSLSLPGGTIAQFGKDYLVQWASGEQVSVHFLTVGRFQFMNVTPAVPDQPGRYVGLLGNVDGDPGNDLQTRSGNVIPIRDGNSTYGQLKNALSSVLPIPPVLNQVETLVFDQIYKDFGNSWRISQSESMLDYATGQTTETFTQRGFPSKYISLNSFVAPDLRQAEATCQQAGVEPEMLEGCIFDVANTGESGFAQAALNKVTSLIKDRVESEIRNRIPIPVPVKLPF